MRKTVWVLATVFLAGTVGSLYYAGWVAGQPQNQVLANAATFASMATATIAILVSALAIYLEKKRADERDDTGPAAWAAATRLAHALYALDWTLIAIGGLSENSSDQQSKQYFAALREVASSLAKAIEASCGRVFGIAWSSDSGGIAASSVLIRLQSHIEVALDERKMTPLPVECMVDINSVYRSIAALRWIDFRKLWETGALPGEFATQSAPELLEDWGDDLWSCMDVIDKDYEERPGFKWSMAFTVRIQPSLLARFRIARQHGYVGHVALWLRRNGKGSFSQAQSEALASSGALWDLERTPEGVRAAQIYWEATGDLQWVGILGRTTPTRKSGPDLDWYRQRVERTAQAQGPEHPYTLSARRDLAIALIEAGAPATAAAELNAQLDRRMKISASDPLDALLDRAWLAEALRKAGRADEAISHCRAVVQERGRIQGPDHAQTLEARAWFASALLDAKLEDEAVEQCRALVEDFTRSKGLDAEETHKACSQLANALIQSGRSVEGAEEYRLLASEYARLHGPDDPRTLGIQSELGFAYGKAGNLDAARVEFEQVVDAWLRLKGPDSVESLAPRHHLAFVLEESGNFDDAIRQYWALVEDRRRIYGPDHLDTLNERASLSRSLGRAGRHHEEVTHRRSLVADRQRTQGLYAPDTLNERASLATSLTQAGEHTEAIEAWQALVADRQREQGQNHPDTLNSRARLAEAFAKADRLEDCVATERLLLVDRVAIQGSEHPDTVLARVTLAVNLWLTGERQDASRLMSEALPQVERLHGPNHPDTLKVREMAEEMGSYDPYH